MTALNAATARSLLAAADRFLEASVRATKRRVLADRERSLAAAFAAAFVAQGRAYTRRLLAHGDIWPVREAEATPEELASIVLLLGLFDAASLEVQVLFTAPLVAAVAATLREAGESTLAAVVPRGAIVPDVALAFTLDNPRAVAYLESVGGTLITRIDETTRQDIRRILVDGAARGQSVGQVAREITKRFKEFGAPAPQQHIKNRAELVAATELGEAYEHGNLLAVQQLADAGYGVEKAWQTVGDARVSPECRANQAAGWIPLAQAFPSGVQRPLQHPGCRCSAIYRAKEG